MNDFRGRTGWACPVPIALPGCQVSGDLILEQLHFEDFTVAEAFMGLLLLTVGGPRQRGCWGTSTGPAAPLLLPQMQRRPRWL